jgi:carboxyl-terminal processing protease
MTIAQFFRINGGTTQLRGVTPDINFPTLGDEADFGESSYGNALPWVQIKAADYVSAGDLSSILPLLKANHEARVNKDADFKYLQEDIAEFNSQRKSEQISLNEAERRKEREAQEERIKNREKDKTTGKADIEFQDDGLQSNERNLAADIAREKSREDAKDIFLTEAANILSDEVGLLNTDAKLAASVLQKAVIH